MLHKKKKVVKERPKIDRKPDALFNIDDEVICEDFEGLTGPVIQWLQLKEYHQVEHVYSSNFEPILLLKPVDGVECPRLGEDPYPFIGSRFRKRTDDSKS